MPWKKLRLHESNKSGLIQWLQSQNSCIGNWISCIWFRKSSNCATQKCMSKCTDTRNMGSTLHVPSLSFANKVLIVLHNKIMSWLINSVSHSFLWSFTICVYCEQEKERGRDAKRKGIYSSSRYFCKIILLYCNRVTELQI